MATIKNHLLWEKWRPKSMDDLILLPRISKLFEDGLKENYIFYGSFGTGKTSLARILIGHYTKDKPYLEINSSLYTSIDVLRNEIENFCKYTPMMETDSEFKYIFLDEFERTSIQFQDAFKAFVEKYDGNVIFLISTNHVNKIDGGIKSRIKPINFDCENQQEEKFLKTEIYKRIKNFILPAESLGLDKPCDISKDDLAYIINKKFPDFRSILVDVQFYLKTGIVGSSDTGNVSNKLKMDLYNMIYDESIDYEGIYHFLMSSFGGDRIDIMIKLLGKDFIDWSVSNKKNIDKLFECNYIIADYASKLETNTDPIILGMTIIGKLRDLLR